MTIRPAKCGQHYLLLQLMQNISTIKEDIQDKPIKIKSKIYKGDCRKILKISEGIKNFKLCITSPPYLNTFDYTDIYRSSAL